MSTLASARPAGKIPVYGPNTPTSLQPDYFLSRGDARAFVASGIARWINRANAIRLLRKAVLKIRDESCKMGERVMIAYCDGKVWAEEMVKASAYGVARAAEIAWANSYVKRLKAAHAS